MTKVVHCRDLGFDCDGIVRAESEDEALQQVAEHAMTVHHLDTVSAELAEKAREVMVDE